MADRIDAGNDHAPGEHLDVIQRRKGRKAPRVSLKDVTRARTSALIEAHKLAFPNPMDRPGFRKWFGRSKVVDQKGDPLVVFHGTNAVFKSFQSLSGDAA
jgi:hypothetical protein